MRREIKLFYSAFGKDKDYSFVDFVHYVRYCWICWIDLDFMEKCLIKEDRRKQ
ncbi:MAG: hypothetical protein WC523_04955 [Patescibacteria group bacterium]